MQRPFEIHPVEPGPGERFQSAAARPSTDAVQRDVQRVLGGAVERIQIATGCERVAAWALRPSGEAYVATARYSGSPPAEPERETFERLSHLAGPTDLREQAHPEALRRLPEQISHSSVTPVVTPDGTPVAVLLVEAVGAVGEPGAARALAALEAARRRLEAPLAAALAMGRLCELDDQVCRLDRLAALGSLTSEITHEIRNPLVGIKTFLDLLPERRDDPEFLTHFLEIASAEVRRMERLLDSVLEHARPETNSGAAEGTDVVGVFESVAALVRHLAARRNIRMEWSGRTPSESGDAAEPLRVATSRDALLQLTLNLGLNAIAATPEGGRVELRARARRSGVAITVSDSGPGIPEELRTQVFEPFFSTRRDHSGGLGLAITRRLVERAGGAIELGASESGGAEFRVWLPAAAAGS